MIELKGLSKKYIQNDIESKVFDNINLIIKENEIAAIVGPSGSGKSTLLNIIGLMDKPSSGEYIYNGKEIKLNDMKPIELAYMRNSIFGFIYQNFALIENLTIRENLELPLKYRSKHEKVKFNKKAAQIKILEHLKKFNLEDKLNKFPYELSGGEQQRIAIIRAIINDAKIILADEPTGALDNKMSNIVFDKLLELNKTVIIVTHDLSIAKKCDRIITLEKT
ncbi:ABC transporter ATP-binding protein [Clostridium sp.]|uniref:ABC transporter ATP-binding protein n=1 Tax=Clostridium sp. TaxID=1506 RepID=UPI002FC90670